MSDVSRIKSISIKWDKNLCTGCMSCMVVCSERHTGMSAPSRAKIRVLVDPLGSDLDAHYCRQCRNAPCARACPLGAISYSVENRAWLVDADICSGCGACVEACPFDAMRLDPVSDVAIKCDLCQGAFRCVDVCPSGALGLRGRESEE